MKRYPQAIVIAISIALLCCAIGCGKSEPTTPTQTADDGDANAVAVMGPQMTIFSCVKRIV